MKRKAISVILGLVMVTSLAAGCSGKEKKETENVTSDTKNTKTVTLSCWYDEDDMEPILTALNESLAGEYSVEYTYIALSDYNNIMSTQLAAGEGPDIISEGTNFPARIKAGNVKEITGADYLEGFNEAGFSLCKDGDKIYGIPSYGWFSGVWYNKDIFEENGITKAPENFDELVEVCGKLKDQGVQPMGFGLADGDTAVHSLLGVLENDFYEASDEGKKFDDEFAKGEKTMDGTINPYVEKWYTLVEKGYINETMVGISNEQALNDFIAGKTAIFNGGPWQYSSLKDAGMNFGMIPNMGSSNENQYLLGGPAVSFGINKNTKNEAGAERVMEALASVEVQQAFVDANIGGSTYREGVTVNMPEEYDGISEILEAGNIACSWDRWGVNMPSQSLFDEFMAQIQGLVTGDLTVDEFAKAIDTKADSIRYE